MHHAQHCNSRNPRTFVADTADVRAAHIREDRRPSPLATDSVDRLLHCCNTIMEKAAAKPPFLFCEKPMPVNWRRSFSTNQSLPKDSPD